MSAVWASTVVLGVLQLFVVLVMLWEVRTTREAYLEGRILVRLRPRESSGFVNLRVENVGAGPVEDVKLTFPYGFPAVPDRQQQVDLSACIPKNLGTFGPREFREWNVGFMADRYGSSLPDVIPYALEYKVPRAQWLRAIPLLDGRRWVRGHLCFSAYKGVLLNPYVGLEDIHRELRSLTDTLKKIQMEVSRTKGGMTPSPQLGRVEGSNASDE